MSGLGVGGLFGLLGLVAFGSIVPVLPTGAAVSAAAVLARDNQPWEIALVVLFGAVGAYLGDLVMYAVLRVAGEPLAERIGWLHADDPEGTLQRMRVRLEEHEVRSFVLSRLVPAGRIPVLLAAALGGYPLGRFVTANIGAAVVLGGDVRRHRPRRELADPEHPGRRSGPWSCSPCWWAWRHGCWAADADGLSALVARGQLGAVLPAPGVEERAELGVAGAAAVGQGLVEQQRAPPVVHETGTASCAPAGP